MRRTLLITAATSLLLSGCTLDLVEPDLFAARFFTTLVLRPDGEDAIFFLDAKLEPGIGREGRRAVPDPHLEVNAAEYLPALTDVGDPPAEYGWRIESGIAPSPQASVRIRIPMVANLPSPHMLELPAGISLLPAGPIQVPPGEDLVLHLVPPPADPAFLRWSLSLTNRMAGPAYLHMVEGVGQWPAEIRVPDSQLPHSASFQLRAVVRVIAEFEPAGKVEDFDVLGRIDFVMERIVSRGDHLLTGTGVPD